LELENYLTNIAIMSNPEDDTGNSNLSLEDLALQATGHYIDGDDPGIFVHRGVDGNFSENIGSRDIISVTSSADPWATHGTFTIIFKKMGNLVTMQLPATVIGGSTIAMTATQSTNTTGTITFNATSATIPGLGAGVPPVVAEDRPRYVKTIPCIMQNNGAPATGYCTVGVDGSLAFTVLPAGAPGNFTAAQPCGVYPQDICWECKR
jgi:hypothetical protein